MGVRPNTPEANIRVDLLLIWPIVGLGELWAVVRAAKGWRISRAGPPLLGLALACIAQPLLATVES